MTATTPDAAVTFDVVHVTSAHSVGDTRIFVKEARSLTQAGYRVAVLAPGAGAAAAHEMRGGVAQITLPRPVGRFARFTRFGNRLLNEALALRPRLVHLHDPDLLRLRARFQAAGVRVIYDMHEDFPKALLSRNWLGPVTLRHAAARLVDGLETRALARVDGVVLADRQLLARLPDPAPPHAVVRNYPDLSEWTETPRLLSEGPIRCVYVGDITRARGLTRMCDAIAACRAAGRPATLDIVGPCPPALEAEVAAHPAASAVTLHGWQCRSAVIALLARSDVGLSLLEPTLAYRDALPVKVLEYLVSGLAVVATDLPRLRAEAPLKEGLFLVANAAPPNVLADAVRQAFLSGTAERQAVRSRVRAKYDWAEEAHQLIGLYKSLLPLRTP